MPKRSRFSKEEEELMKKIVADAKGGTGGKVFWQKIKDNSGIFDRHSAESLKFHWKLMIRRENVTKGSNREPVNKRNQKSWVKAEENQENQGFECGNRLFDPGSEINKRFEVSVYSGIEQELFPIGNLSEKAINKLFHKLYFICCQAADFEIDQEVVLMVLDEHEGRVSETIKYFQGMKST